MVKYLKPSYFDKAGVVKHFAFGLGRSSAYHQNSQNIQKMFFFMVVGSRVQQNIKFWLIPFM